MDLEEARQALFAQVSAVSEIEKIALSQARGRILAETVKAQLPLPPFAASAMDGYALRQADLADTATFRVIGESLAGHPFQSTIDVGECVRIFTGAVVPPGADLIVLQETLVAQQTLADGRMEVRFEPQQIGEDYIRPIGNDVEAGQALATPGDCLSPFLLGTLAAAGVTQICVYRPVVVGIFSSGDELVDPGVPPENLLLGQIYDSNSFTLASLLQHLPVELARLPRLKDEPMAVAAALSAAAQRCDLLITSGGVSVGDADFIGATIARMGELAFWRLNLKPGKPLAFGKLGDCWIFGLPGNPVSTIVTCLLLVLPTLQVMCGTLPKPLLRVRAVLDSAVSHQPGRAEYQRGIYQMDPRTGEHDDAVEHTALRVSHTGDQGSNRLSTFAGANCLIEIPKDSGDLAAGTVVDILPLSDLLN
ncbi:MAG: molybdopterin molybdenumtransferase MoeA [Proteobacteria bacterium]|nr:molybdopterin molybdenumtransferase MoeA [Pseudomonadota bacterium]